MFKCFNGVTLLLSDMALALSILGLCFLNFIFVFFYIVVVVVVIIIILNNRDNVWFVFTFMFTSFFILSYTSSETVFLLLKLFRSCFSEGH